MNRKIITRIIGITFTASALSFFPAMGMNWDIGAKVFKATGGVLYHDLDRDGLADSYTYDFIQTKIEDQFKKNYKDALNFLEDYVNSYDTIKWWQLWKIPAWIQKRKFIYDLKNNPREFYSYVAGKAFTYPIWISDKDFVFFVNTAYKRKLNGEFKPIELYYAHMLCPESAKTCNENEVHIRANDIITIDVCKKWGYISTIPRSFESNNNL